MLAQTVVQILADAALLAFADFEQFALEPFALGNLLREGTRAVPTLGISRLRLSERKLASSQTTTR